MFQTLTMTGPAMAWTEMLIPVSFFTMSAFIVWTLVAARTNRIAVEHRSKLQEKMMERFSTASEFVEFLRSPEGTKYLSTFTEAPDYSPLSKSLGSVRAGLVIAMMSLGLIVAGFVSGYGHDSGILAIGTLGLFLGAGFLMSAFATFVLSRKWRLIDDHRSSVSE